jgi:hypothetical protein
MEDKKINNKKTQLNTDLDEFLGTPNESLQNCPDGVCILKGDRSLVERINKKIITEDGRQLLK